MRSARAPRLCSGALRPNWLTDILCPPPDDDDGPHHWRELHKRKNPDLLYAATDEGVAAVRVEFDDASGGHLPVFLDLRVPAKVGAPPLRCWIRGW